MGKWIFNGLIEFWSERSRKFFVFSQKKKYNMISLLFMKITMTLETKWCSIETNIDQPDLLDTQQSLEQLKNNIKDPFKDFRYGFKVIAEHIKWLSLQQQKIWFKSFSKYIQDYDFRINEEIQKMVKKYHLVSDELLDMSPKVKDKDKNRYLFYMELKNNIREIESKWNLINTMIDGENNSDDVIQSKINEYFSLLGAFFLKATPPDELVEWNIYQEQTPFTWKKDYNKTAKRIEKYKKRHQK